MKEYYFRINVREDRLEQVSYARAKSKKRFPIKELLIFLIICVIGFLLFSCSSKGIEATEPESATDSYYYMDGKGKGYLIDAQDKPKKVILHNSLSREENLEIIHANGNRITRNTRDDLLDFKFENLNRVIYHRDYVGIFTGSRVMVPVYNEYQTLHYAWGLLVLGGIIFFCYFLSTYNCSKKIKLIWKSDEGSKKGSITCFFAQLFAIIWIVSLIVLILILIIFYKYPELPSLVFICTPIVSFFLMISFTIGSTVNKYLKVFISFICFGVISIFLYKIADLSEYIAFYFTLIPAFLGIVLGLTIIFIKAKMKKKLNL